MLAVILKIFVGLLAAYGAVSLGMELIEWMHFSGCKESERVKVVLLVKNRENDIEGIVRSFLNRCVLNKMLPCDRLIVADMGSNDDTVEILNRLQGYYDNLDVMRMENKSEILKDCLYNKGDII